MGRKADPKGKDRPRTIVLSGDVGEIAQKLADKGELSATLSELLRSAYGFGDKIDEKKRQLTAILDEKQRLAAQEIELIAEIDTLEAQTIEKRATILPQLAQRLKILEERRQRVQAEANRHIDRNIVRQKLNALDKIDGLIAATRTEMEEFE